MDVPLLFLIEDTLYDDEHIYGTDDHAVGVCTIEGYCKFLTNHWI